MSSGSRTLHVSHGNLTVAGVATPTPPEVSSWLMNHGWWSTSEGWRSSSYPHEYSWSEAVAIETVKFLMIE